MFDLCLMYKIEGRIENEGTDNKQTGNGLAGKREINGYVWQGVQ